MMIMDPLVEQYHDKLPFKYLKAVEKKLDEGYDKKKAEKALQAMAIDFEKAQFEAGEAVGIVAAQSIGEPGTQMSLPYSEKVLVKMEDNIYPIKIGEFIDAYIPEKNELQIYDFPKHIEAEVLSLNKDEKLEWKQINQISRHKNTNDLIEIKLRSGRKITATKTHAFVTRQDNKIIPIEGAQLKAGDRLPVIKKMPEIESIPLIELDNFLEKEEYWYGSELQKARMSGLNGSDFIVPVKIDQLRNHISQNKIEDGFVYPYQTHGTGIPETLPLDESVGWFFGIYLAEGNATKNYVSISNTSKSILARVRNFAKKYNLTYNEYDNNRGFALGHDIRINSTVLSDLLTKMFKTGAINKFVNPLVFNADIKFVGALLRGYFDGDGNVSLERKCIRASSMSKELIDGIALLLNRFGIFSTKSAGKCWTLSIPAAYAKVFKENIGFEKLDKSVKLEKLVALNKGEKSYDITEMFTGFGNVFVKLAKKIGMPSRLVNNFTKRQKIGRKTLEKYIKMFETKIKDCNELQMLRRMQNSDVAWDEIVEIKSVNAGEEYLYDFSVDGLETFVTFEGVVTHNTMRTFHAAGVAELATPLGLPRFMELVDLRKRPKMPIMTIYFENASKDKAIDFAHKLEEITLKDISVINENFQNKIVEIIVDEERRKELDVSMEEIVKRIEKKLRKRMKKVESNVIFFEPKTNSMKTIRIAAKRIEETHISGVGGIKKAAVIEHNGEFLIQTEGTNLRGVLKLDGVDKKRAKTNNLKEVEEVLGIEAARNMLLNEMRNVLDKQGLYVNIRHLMILADLMGSSGKLQAVGRHGVAGAKTSVFAKAAYEQTTRHLLDAALEGTREDLKGVTENIIVGQTVPVGTGTVGLLMKRKKK